MINNPVHPNQHAYTPGRSTGAALHMIAGRIEKSLDNKEFTLGVFIDIEGVFDKTTFPKITAELTNRDVLLIVGGWVSIMLSRRAVQINVGNIAVRGTVERGYPQGGVLSSLLWNLVLNSLLRHLNSEGFHRIAYADDLTILFSGKFETALCNRMQMALRIIEELEIPFWENAGLLWPT